MIINLKDYKKEKTLSKVSDAEETELFFFADPEVIRKFYQDSYAQTVEITKINTLFGIYLTSSFMARMMRLFGKK